MWAVCYLLGLCIDPKGRSRESNTSDGHPPVTEPHACVCLHILNFKTYVPNFLLGPDRHSLVTISLPNESRLAGSSLT